jgi:hemoglobin/transferrin/lactoferrin receptor protein
MPAQPMHTVHRRALAAAVMAALYADGSFAGEAGSIGSAAADAGAIDEIVVVANKHGRSRRDVTANVSVFAADDFHFELAASVADIFRYAPGIDYEADRTRFGSESINIRGIAGNRVAILVDGVPVSDQFDVGSYSNATRDLVSAGFIDQVEVLHGPASALYGSSAIGGVVALRSIDPAQLTGRTTHGGTLFSNWHGDDSSVTATAMHAAAGDSIAILAGLSAANGQEVEAGAAESSLDRRDFDSRSFLFKLVADNASGNTWRATAYHKESDVQSDSTSMLGNGRFRTTSALRGDDNYATNIVAAEFRFTAASRAADDGVVRGWYQGTEITQATVDERALAARPVTIDRLFSFEQDGFGIEANLQKKLETGRANHRVSYGFEVRRRETAEFRDGVETGLEDSVTTNVLLGESFPLRDFPLSRTDEWGAFVEDTVSFGRWSLTAALRADHYDMQPAVDSMYAEDYPFAEPVAISEFELSPKAGLIYRVGDASELYFQYARGFRAPPFEDANVSLELPLFNVRAVPNPDLRSETSDGFDLGMRWRGSRSSAYLSLFRTEYTDFIESKVRLGPDPESGRILFQSQNIAAAVIEGIEAGTTVALTAFDEGLSLDGGLFVARSENRENGEALNSVGPPQAVASLNWQSAGGHVQTSLRGTFTDDWSTRDETAGELFKPPGYAVFDLYVAWRVNHALTLRAGVRNLTDKIYWAWTDVRGLAPDDPVIPYLSSPGRSFSAGIDMTW